MSTVEFKDMNGKLVEKILEQGQKLRNAMVQSILQNDPLNSEIIYNKHFNTPMSSATSLSEKKTSDVNLLDAFLNGDYLTKNEEETALNTIRTMSVSDVCKSTERTLLSKCSCATCNAYNKNNLQCDLRRTEGFKEKCLSNYIKQKNWGSEYILKYVDTLKVILQSIHLNNLGNKKVTHAYRKQFSFGANETYFVEYYIPEIFTKELPRSKSKVDSGLESNHVRVCARKTNEDIYIRQIFNHNICNLYDCTLEDHNITFFVRYKSRGQKNSELLGVAKFNFGLFVSSKNFSCCKTLPIYLTEDSPIVIGTIKVTLQLGCGKIYFGQEFVDAVLSQKVLSDEADSGDESKDIGANFKSNILKEKSVPEKDIKEEIQQDKHITLTKQNLEKPKLAHSKSVSLSKNKDKDVVIPVEKFNKVQNCDQNLEKELLLGFIYVSEAQFLSACPSSYITCQPYCQSDTSSSKVVYNSTNPLYNFCQTVPLLYEDDILLKLRENFMIIEFWEKDDQTDALFGLTKLPLNQFYLAYRNVIILQHLKRNKLPIIGTDWWEPIYTTDSHELIGQVQVLTALGTENQIRNLELERGFKDDIVKAKFPSTTQVRANVKVPQNSSYFRGATKVVKQQPKVVYNKGANTLNNTVNPNSVREPFNEPKPPRLDVCVQLDKGVNTDNIVISGSFREPLNKPNRQTADVAVQSDLDVRMTAKDNSQNLPQMQDMLSSFMKLLEQKPVRMDNSTNTEPVVSSGSSTQIHRNMEPEPPQVRRTSDLLDSLQRALILDNKQIKKPQKPPSFNAQIIINSANQLPSRRKIKSKSKRTKGRSPKQDENILPSTYVSFETMPGDPLQVTSVFPKSTSPQWNYSCEVNLPMNLLTNGQKRLIFKVWKKCTNAVLQPNMQTDLVLGFAAVDLSVILAGLPNIQGWFNIVDFSGKCNGQINIHVNPLEDLGKVCSSNKNDIEVAISNTTASLSTVDKEECDELLSRALKRKFTELDEITQRLRLRLSEVVSDDSEGSNDEIAEEFENDINNLCIEEDFELINFEEEARRLNVTCKNPKKEDQEEPRLSDLLSVTFQPGSSQQSIPQEMKTEEKFESDVPELSADKDDSSESTESSTTQSLFMDKHILQGKQRIDTLLEKLSLINSEVNQSFSSRYVSGCSVSNENPDAQNILKDLDHNSRPNIRAGTSYDSLMFRQLYGGPTSLSSRSCGNLKSNFNSDSSSNSKLGSATAFGSETSVISNFSDCRPNPDGQGTNSDDKGT